MCKVADDMAKVTGVEEMFIATWEPCIRPTSKSDPDISDKGKSRVEEHANTEIMDGEASLNAAILRH